MRPRLHSEAQRRAPASARERLGPIRNEPTRGIRAAQDMPAGAPGRARGAWMAIRPEFPSGRPRPQERLGWRQGARNPARARAQTVLDGHHLRVRHFPEVRAPGQASPHQAAGVLVQAAWSTMVPASSGPASSSLVRSSWLMACFRVGGLLISVARTAVCLSVPVTGGAADRHRRR